MIDSIVNLFSGGDMKRIGGLFCFFVLLACGVGAKDAVDGPDSITNYREYSAAYSSSGQPTADQLKSLAENKFERVINLGFTNHHAALAGEDDIVKNLGMEYVHIPVVFDAPNKDDFDIFAAVMAQAPGKKTLLHCQVNYRASSFSLLYRVIYEDVPIEEAKEDMNSVWAPNETWRQFMFDVLENNGKSPYCDGCDWGSE